MQETAKTKETRIEEFRGIMDNIFGRYPDALNNIIGKLDTAGFFTAPASTKHHGAYEGGLFEHSKTVTEQLLNFTSKLGLEWGLPAVRIL